MVAVVTRPVVRDVAGAIVAAGARAVVVVGTRALIATGTRSVVPVETNAEVGVGTRPLIAVRADRLVDIGAAAVVAAFDEQPAVSNMLRHARVRHRRRAAMPEIADVPGRVIEMIWPEEVGTTASCLIVGRRDTD